MNKNIKQKWLTALRSGEYEQGIGQLKQGDKFCCLGVLCDIVKDDYDLQWNKFDHLHVSDNPFGHISFIPPKISKLLHLDYLAHEHPLAAMNDNGRLSFNEIADWIEKREDL